MKILLLISLIISPLLDAKDCFLKTKNFQYYYINGIKYRTKNEYTIGLK